MEPSRAWLFIGVTRHPKLNRPEIQASPAFFKTATNYPSSYLEKSIFQNTTKVGNDLVAKTKATEALFLGNFIQVESSILSMLKYRIICAVYII